MKIHLIIGILIFSLLSCSHSQRGPASTGQSCLDLIGELFDDIHFVGESSFGHGPQLTYISTNELKNLDEVEDLKVWSFNTYNLVENKGKVKRNEAGDIVTIDGIAPEYVKGPIAKDIRHQEEIAQIILDHQPDFMALQEVESVTVLDSFIRDQLQGRYIPLLAPGNDSRGINVALIVRKDLNMKVEFHSFKNMEVDGKNVFARDYPVALVWPAADTSTDRKPVMALGLRHHKSKRDRAGDPLSTMARRLEVEKAEEVHDMIAEKYGSSIPFFVMGDFNNSVNDLAKAPEFTPLYERGFRDSIDVAETPFEKSRVTHTYHPKNGPTEADQIDSIQVNETVQEIGAVKRAGVYRYTDSEGSEKAIPQTHDQRKENPSDHFPVWSEIDFQKLMNHWNLQSFLWHRDYSYFQMAMS